MDRGRAVAGAISGLALSFASPKSTQPTWYGRTYPKSNVRLANAGIGCRWRLQTRYDEERVIRSGRSIVVLAMAVENRVCRDGLQRLAPVCTHRFGGA